MTYLIAYLAVGFLYASIMKAIYDDGLFFRMHMSDLVATAILWPYFVLHLMFKNVGK